MKSFSASSFASDNSVALDLAAAAVRDDPHALFTNFQWFLLAGRDTVFFTAFSTQSFDKDSMGNLVAEMVSLAPQLTHGFFPREVFEGEGIGQVALFGGEVV